MLLHHPTKDNCLFFKLHPNYIKKYQQKKNASDGNHSIRSKLLACQTLGNFLVNWTLIKKSLTKIKPKINEK